MRLLYAFMMHINEICMSRVLYEKQSCRRFRYSLVFYILVLSQAAQAQYESYMWYNIK